VRSTTPPRRAYGAALQNPGQDCKPCRRDALTHQGQQLDDDRRNDVRHNDVHGRDQWKQERGITFEEVHDIRDVILVHIRRRVPLGFGVDLDRPHPRRAEFGRRDREDGAPGAQVGNGRSRANDILYEQQGASRRRMVARPECHARIDDDRMATIEPAGQPRWRDRQAA
jgi:hypothetical protein